MKLNIKNNLLIRKFDILKKVLFFSVIGLCIYFFYNEIFYVKNFNPYNFKIENYFIEFMNINLFALSLFSFYFLQKNFLNSNYNKTKFERFIHKFLSKIPKFKIDYRIYTAVIIMLYGFILYYVLFFIKVSYINSQLIAGIDYSKMEPIINLENIEISLLLIPIILFFSFFIFTKNDKEVNEDIINGIHLCLFLNIVFNIFSLISIAFIIIMCLIYMLEFRKLSSKEIIKKISYLILGFGIMILFIICANKFKIIEMKNYDNNLNNRVLSINGNNYNYNTSVFIHNDNKEDHQFEYLIESYAGQSMNNTLDLFSYIFSNEYKGDKERSYQLFAKIYEKNSLIMKNNEEKAFNLLNTGVSSVDYFEIIIPYMIYEVSPYNSTKKTIENILNKDYQSAVDNYIEYGLNSDVVVVSKFTKKERNPSGFIGSPVYQEMIYSLVKNGYAKFDIEKIKNSEYKEKWRRKLQEKPYYYKKYPEENIEKWFKVFGV